MSCHVLRPVGADDINLGGHRSRVGNCHVIAVCMMQPHGSVCLQASIYSDLYSDDQKRCALLARHQLRRDGEQTNGVRSATNQSGRTPYLHWLGIRSILYAQRCGNVDSLLLLVSTCMLAKCRTQTQDFVHPQTSVFESSGDSTSSDDFKKYHATIWGKRADTSQPGAGTAS
jgi:hypothetical protein